MLCLVSNVCIVCLFYIQGGWNNSPSASQFQAIFRRLMVRCGVSPSETGNVAAQDEAVCLAAVEMSSTETPEEHPSPSANISAVVSDHSYLPTRFGGLVENALVYIAGFVVWQILRKLSCDVCRASLVRDAVPSSFDENYHLLTPKNRGGLVIPSQGTVKVLRAAERVIRQASTRQAPKLSTVTYIVREGDWNGGCFSPWGTHWGDTVWHRQPSFQLVVIGCVCVSEDKATPHWQTHLSWPAEREHEKEILQNSPLSGLLAHLNFHEQICVNICKYSLGGVMFLCLTWKLTFFRISLSSVCLFSFFVIDFHFTDICSFSFFWYIEI